MKKYKDTKDVLTRAKRLITTASNKNDHKKVAIINLENKNGNKTTV